MKSSAVARGSRQAVGRAPAGSGGSWSKEKALAGASATLDKLLRLLGVFAAACDNDRAGVLEVADRGDDASLRLLDDGAALRRLVLHLLDEHLGAALRHVPQDLLLDLIGHAAQGIGILLWGGLVVVFVADYILRPKLVGTRIKMTDLLVFIAIFGGIEAFGIMGIVLGPVAVAVLLSLIRIYQSEYRPEGPVVLRLEPPAAAPGGREQQLIILSACVSSSSRTSA